MGKTLHFKSKSAYMKYLAYGHIHGDFARVKGNQKIVIAGKPHKVIHVKKPKNMQIKVKI